MIDKYTVILLMYYYCVVVTNYTSLNNLVHTVTNYGLTFLDIAVYSIPNNILS